MSYLRGDQYIWSDDERLHIWVADGYDGWDAAGWADGVGASKESGSGASGVGVSKEIMDAFVMMRVAELVEEDLIDEAVVRAMAHGGGNGGCEALAKNAERLKAVLKRESI